MSTRARAEGFRCPQSDRLVEVGDSSEEVEESCGPPKSREDVRGEGCSDSGRCYSGKIGERWVYDFGPSYFKRYLLFIGDHLSQIQSGKYGKAH
jgi:hypothetical protein